jgi:hypothetical protein
MPGVDPRPILGLELTPIFGVVPKYLPAIGGATTGLAGAGGAAAGLGVGFLATGVSFLGGGFPFLEAAIILIFLF